MVAALPGFFMLPPFGKGHNKTLHHAHRKLATSDGGLTDPVIGL